MQKFLITDLTSFGEQHICIGMINVQTLECIRPLNPKSTSTPKFFSLSYIDKHNITLGSIVTIEGRLENMQTDPPHTEDYFVHGDIGIIEKKNIKDSFHILDKILYKNVQQGFGNIPNMRCLPYDGNIPNRSIITLKVPSEQISLLYKFGKIKVKWSYDFGKSAYIPFQDIRITSVNIEQLNEHNEHIHKFQYTYLRLGLTRLYKSPDGRYGYWTQINTLVTSND